MARVSQAMVERAVGGAAALLELIDKNRTGSLDDASCQDYLADVLDEAHAEVNSYIAGSVDLADPALQSAPLLVRYELAIAVYLVWLKGTGGLAVPANIEQARGDVLVELEKIKDRKKGVGLVEKPKASAPLQQVTKTDSEPYFNPRGPRRRFDGWS